MSDEAEAIRKVANALEVADWLAGQREKFRAEQVRVLCRRYGAVRGTVKRLNREAARLRQDALPLARERQKANLGVMPLVAELETTADALDRQRRVASAVCPDDATLRLTDAPYLIDLLRRAAGLLR